MFGNAAKVVKEYVGKGDKLAVDGSLEYRDYTDKDGVKRNAAEVVVRPYRGEMTRLSRNGDVLRGYDARMVMLDGLKP